MNNLREIRNQLASLPAMENRQRALEENIRLSEQELLALLEKYEKEKRDLERIEKSSFSAFVFKLLDQYDQKLEKEQREEMSAKLAYDCALLRLQALKFEKDELKARIMELKQDARYYDHELAQQRMRLLDNLSTSKGEIFQRLEANRNAVLMQITEIKEALSALARVKATATDALDSLNSADGWATFDVWTRGGIFTDMAKYSHIDKAEENFHRLSSQLCDLRRELRDVHGISVPSFQTISSGQRMVDFWFDNIFTNLSVRSAIRDNIGKIENLLETLRHVKRELDSKLQEVDRMLAQNQQQEEEILVSIG